MRKSLFLTLFLLFGIQILQADAHIFVYHRFGDSKHASTNTSLKTLEKQFQYFKDEGYEVITQKRLLKALRSGEKISDRWVVLNIDDSYKSFYQNGLPLFKKFAYPFTLYIYIQATEGHYGDFMTWDMIKDTQKYGEIGLHSYGHPHLVSLSSQAIEKDTQKALDSFKKHLGYAPVSYAYPYGEYDPRVRKVIETFSFDLIMNQNAGAVAAFSDPHDLDRIALTGAPNLKAKLKIRSLKTQWHAPTVYPKDGILKTIHATISPEIKKIEYYVSGDKWHYAKVVEGDLLIHPKLRLSKKRTRIFLKYKNRQSSKILVKGSL